MRAFYCAKKLCGLACIALAGFIFYPQILYPPIVNAQRFIEEEPLYDFGDEKNEQSEDKALVQYIGNAESLKFHRPCCPFAIVMAEFRVRRFPSRSAAVNAGMRPCRYCLPPVWTSVKAKLLTMPSNLPLLKPADY